MYGKRDREKWNHPLSEEERRDKHRRSKKARRRLRKKLGKTSELSCEWCGASLYFRENLPLPMVRESHHWFYLRQVDGEIIHVRKATVDHVVPMSEGGTDEYENLVPACQRCNANRNRKARLPHNVYRCKGCGVVLFKERLLCRACKRLGW